MTILSSTCLAAKAFIMQSPQLDKRESNPRSTRQHLPKMLDLNGTECLGGLYFRLWTHTIREADLRRSNILDPNFTDYSKAAFSQPSCSSNLPVLPPSTLVYGRIGLMDASEVVQ